MKTLITERFGADYPVMITPMATNTGGCLAVGVPRPDGQGRYGQIRTTRYNDVQIIRERAAINTVI